jgi:hypothetical protein
MRSGLQNVEVDITFRTGRDDAEIQAKVVGTVDPMAVKKEDPVYFAKDGKPKVIDHRTTEKTLAEQWEGWTQTIQRLPKRSAFVRDPGGTVTQLKSPDMPDPVVDPDEFSRVREHYLNECFYAASFVSPDTSIPLQPSFQPAVQLRR